MASKKYKTKIVDISTKNKDNFIPFIPGSKRQYLDRPGCFCLGAVVEEGNSAHPVGVLIFSEKAILHEGGDFSCRINLLWFYVSETHRNHGIGSALFEAFINSVPEQSRIDVTLPASAGYDDIYNYLVNYGFEFRLEEYFELTLSANEITENKRINALLTEPEDVIPLSDITPKIWNSLSGLLLSLGLSSSVRDYDPFLSAMLMKDSSPLAVSLIQKDTWGNVCPVLFEKLPGCDTDPLVPLISHTVDALMELPISTRVILKPRSDLTGALIDRFFPKKTPAIARAGNLYL